MDLSKKSKHWNMNIALLIFNILTTSFFVAYIIVMIYGGVEWFLRGKASSYAPEYILKFSFIFIAKQGLILRSYSFFGG